MQNDYDNDVESLLERSIDEIYPTTKTNSNKFKTNRCPFGSTSKSLLHSSGNSTRVRKVKENSKFNNLLLPEGWIRVFHDSGMFFYCHIATKVVTWSMPYEIQTEPARYHRVPVRSIPCLSALSQKCNTTDWDKLIKLNKESPIKKSFHPQETNKVINCDSSAVNDKMSDSTTHDGLEDVVNVTKEFDKITEPTIVKEAELPKEPKIAKEEGEIESDDENESEQSPSGQEPILPKQYQLNNQKSKNNIRSKTLSASDLPTKRKFDEDEMVNSKRPRTITDTDIDTITYTTEPSSNDAERNPETLIKEELDLNCRLLEPAEFAKYCEKIFTFVNEAKYVPRFTFNKKKNHLAIGRNNKVNVPEPQQVLPVSESMVPLSCTMKIKIPNKNLFLELAGRNYSCILNMYCQHAYAATPSFQLSSSMSGIHDFEVVCEINGSTYGVGEGRTKKIAKQKAILKTLEILIPGFSQKLTSDGSDKSLSLVAAPVAGTSQGPITNSDVSDDIYSLFDIMEITDPRVFNYTTKLNSISPYNLLTECMNRHCISDNEIKCKIEKQNRHNIFKLIIGDKEVETNCENKREGRQLAAQYMLAKLHPHIQSWGGILRLYGPGSKPIKRFDMQEMQNLLLEDRGGVKNNLINLLRKKMLDLNEEYEGSADKSKAKFKTSFQSIPIIIFHPDSQVSAVNK